MRMWFEGKRRHGEGRDRWYIHVLFCLEGVVLVAAPALPPALHCLACPALPACPPPWHACRYPVTHNLRQCSFPSLPPPSPVPVPSLSQSQPVLKQQKQACTSKDEELLCRERRRQCRKGNRWKGKKCTCSESRGSGAGKRVVCGRKREGRERAWGKRAV